MPNMPGRNGAGGETSSAISRRSRLQFLDLPSEIHSQIATYLTLEELIPFLCLHPALLSLTSSHLSPFPHLIRDCLDRGLPYPAVLAKLPSLTLLQPDDDGTLFLDVLVRARPRWILERLELGRWTEGIWKEAFERRFLPSWKRYKLEGDSWRAVFLRILGRLEHRNSGCTHDESWTRFITLHRNGSASINRIYSRQFDPYQIYDELKHQNNFASEPTTVRVVVHLQDLRVIVLGVLYRYPSLFVNQNAHDLLHPPLLREEDEPEVPHKASVSEGKRRLSVEGTRTGPVNINGNGVNILRGGTTDPAISATTVNPLSRSLTPSTSSPPSDAPSAPRRATFSSLLSPSILNKTRRPSAQNVPMAPYPSIPRPEARPDSPSSASKGRFGSMLTLTRSRDSDDGGKSSRKWSLGSGRRGSGGDKGGPVIPASALFAGEVNGQNGGTGEDAEAVRVIRASDLFSDFAPAPSVPSASDVPGPSILANPTPLTVAPPSPAAAPPTQLVPVSPDPPFSALPTQLSMKRQLPYPPMRKPQPAPSHRLYPNHTPPTSEEVVDRRQLYPVVEDDYAGNIWATRRDVEEDPDGPEVEDVGWGAKERFVEWDEEGGGRKRWVGPMLVIAQLHPSHHPRPQPPGVDPLSPTEGAEPDLGPKGMYASLGFEDLEAIMGWVELRGGGAYVSDPRKGGMGFDGV